ncbi:MAG: hypothetical protein LBF80_00835, partial [Spirochaetaceae bacterium]|nr:hypothetical protein [Spirochaetaceae bacterium]
MRVKLRLIFMLAAAFEIFTCKSAPAQSVQGVDSPEADGEMVEAMTETDAFEEEIDEDYTTEDYTAIEAENDEIHEELKVTANLDDIPESSFSEVWAYLITGSEGDLKSRYPISDIVYFTSEVDRYGHLVDVPRRKNIG